MSVDSHREHLRNLDRLSFKMYLADGLCISYGQPGMEKNCGIARYIYCLSPLVAVNLSSGMKRQIPISLPDTIMPDCWAKSQFPLLLHQLVHAPVLSFCDPGIGFSICSKSRDP